MSPTDILGLQIYCQCLWALRWLFSCIYLYINCFIFLFLSSSLQDTEIKVAYSQRGGNPLPCYIYSFANYRWTSIELWLCACASSTQSLLSVSHYSFGDEQKLVLLMLDILLKHIYNPFSLVLQCQVSTSPSLYRVRVSPTLHRKRE